MSFLWLYLGRRSLLSHNTVRLFSWLFSWSILLSQCLDRLHWIMVFINIVIISFWCSKHLLLWLSSHSVELSALGHVCFMCIYLEWKPWFCVALYMLHYIIAHATIHPNQAFNVNKWKFMCFLFSSTILL